MATSSASHSSRKRTWPRDSRPMADHRARPVRARAAREPRTERRLSPSRRAMPRAIDAMPTTPASTTRIITTMPMSWISSAGIHSKIARVSPSIGPRAAYMNAAKNTARRTAIDRRQDGPGVHRPGEVGLVVGGDGVAPGRRHELGRVGLRRAGLGALAALVARPELLGAQERVLHAQLRVADDPARERAVGLGHRARRGAGPAREAGGDVGGAEALDVRVQAQVQAERRWGRPAWCRPERWSRSSGHPPGGFVGEVAVGVAALDLGEPAVAAHAHDPEHDLVGRARRWPRRSGGR